MEITCPECQRQMEFRQAFDAAFCWAGAVPAVAFNCPHCKKPSYFGLGATHVEVGFIGAGPPIDPVPMERYAIVVRVRREGQHLTLEYQDARRTLPSANEYLLQERK